MAESSSGTNARPSADLIGGRFAVDHDCPLPLAGGGLEAFAARERSGRRGFMAVRVPDEGSPRARAVATLLGQTPRGVLGPLAVGPAMFADGPAMAVVCPAPPGDPIARLETTVWRPWTESELIDSLLRPVALALAALGERHVTHRAVRPNNLFRSAAGTVVLGCAWASAPARHQPDAFEPPYVALCNPRGRGEGVIADDVYALGVTMLAMAIGRMPLAGLSTPEVVRRKLEFGSFAALAGGARLSPMVGDLLRGMLAEDPDHRPPPSLLSDPAAARARRVAAHPPRRASAPLSIGGVAASSARSVAFALARAPEEGLRLVRSGAVQRWIRRDLGDVTLATSLDSPSGAGASETGGLAAGAESEAVGRQGAFEVMRTIARLDPLAPLCWPGAILWPDGLGTALAALPPLSGEVPSAGRPLADIIETEAIAAWATARSQRGDPAILRVDARQYRAIARGAGGLAHLTYALNPMLPCRSPVLRDRLVTRLTEVLPTLDAMAGMSRSADPLPFDADLLGFVMARGEPALGASSTDLASSDAVASARAVLRVLARLEAETAAAPVPRLARRLGELLAPALAVLRSRTRRTAAERELADACTAGRLGALLATIDDDERQRQDAAEAVAAEAAIARIDAELAALASARPARAAAAARLGAEITGGLGALAATIGLLLGALD